MVGVIQHEAGRVIPAQDLQHGLKLRRGVVQDYATGPVGGADGAGLGQQGYGSQAGQIAIGQAGQVDMEYVVTGSELLEHVEEAGKGKPVDLTRYRQHRRVPRPARQDIVIVIHWAHSARYRPRQPKLIHVLNAA